MASVAVKLLLLSGVYLISGSVVAQCGMGVPSAGNPNCIPPSVQGSPYGNSRGTSQPPVQQQPIIIRHEWADRWGAMVLDDVNPVTGFSTGAKSKQEALNLAKSDCFFKGGGGGVPICLHTKTSARSWLL